MVMSLIILFNTEIKIHHHLFVGIHVKKLEPMSMEMMLLN
jgi:hypothetical protein